MINVIHVRESRNELLFQFAVIHYLLVSITGIVNYYFEFIIKINVYEITNDW